MCRMAVALSIVRFFLLVCACIALPSVANAISYPPYEVYPYVADPSDVPPLNYMKVCEPGRTGEANAAYVVLGISFPRTYPAVSGTYSGDLVIPPSLGVPPCGAEGDMVQSAPF